MGKAKILAFGNLKGGVGKSTVTAMFANDAFLRGKSVVVFDCDDEQATLTDWREMDLEYSDISEDEMYDLTAIKSDELPAMLESLKVIKEENDYLLIDLPGNIMQSGVKECYMLCDMIILLSNITRADILATIKFNEYLKEWGYKGKVVMVPTKINPMYKEWHEFISDSPEEGFINKDELPFPVTKNFIKYDPIAFDRKANTVDKYENSKGNVVGEKLMDELMNIIK
jgi:MinD-like ATPase involved in chromosome partitioning or flagellar assembly